MKGLCIWINLYHCAMHYSNAVMLSEIAMDFSFVPPVQLDARDNNFQVQYAIVTHTQLHNACHKQKKSLICLRCDSWCSMSSLAPQMHEITFWRAFYLFGLLVWHISAGSIRHDNCFGVVFSLMESYVEQHMNHNDSPDEHNSRVIWVNGTHSPIFL